MPTQHEDAPRRSSAVKAEINVTPLVDVVLVLLIIFMVVTPQMESGQPVDLPPARNGKEAKETGLSPATVTLDAKGQHFLGKEPLSRETLLTRLREMRAGTPTQRVLVRGDKAVAYAQMRGLFSTVQELGFPGVGLEVVEAK